MNKVVGEAEPIGIVYILCVLHVLCVQCVLCVLHILYVLYVLCVLCVLHVLYVTQIITKDEHHKQAEDLFAQQGINISTHGRKHLGAAIGQEDFVIKTVKSKVEDWRKELTTLSDIARTKPHAAYWDSFMA